MDSEHTEKENKDCNRKDVFFWYGGVGFLFFWGGVGGWIFDWLMVFGEHGRVKL